MSIAIPGTAVCLALALPSLGAQSVSSHGGAPSHPAPLPAKPAVTVVTEEHLAGVLEVKFSEASGIWLEAGTFRRTDAPAATINELLATFDARPREMFVQSDEWLRAFRRRGEERSAVALHDLTTFYFVDAAPGAIAALCDALNALDDVELAWPAVSGGDPVLATCPAPLGSPNLITGQGYRGEAPDGVDADYANTFSGGAGNGLTVVDVETGWTYDHEDLVDKIDEAFVVWTPANYPWDHGTATMGEIIGVDNGFGVLGIAYEAGGLLATHTPVGLPFNVPGAVANAAAAAQPGDLVMLEVQCFGGAPAPFPCEFDPAIFATVQAATANGIHVVAAAGNGNNDLDGAAYGGAFDLNQQDSGAILVGATNGVSLSKAGCSNFGSRCTSSGWGFDVVTAGYGDAVSGPPTQEYTQTFSGTSSATPIVAGAAAVLTTIYREAFGGALTPLEVRDALAITGTATTGEVGSRPNLFDAIAHVGIPRSEITGDTGAGGTLSVSQFGTAGDAYLLLASADLATNPLAIPPFGFLFLNPVGSSVAAVGAIGGGGVAVDNFPIPAASPLSGTPLYMQAGQVFAGGANGSLTNYLEWIVP